MSRSVPIAKAWSRVLETLCGESVVIKLISTVADLPMSFHPDDDLVLFASKKDADQQFAAWELWSDMRGLSPDSACNSANLAEVLSRAFR